MSSQKLIDMAANGFCRPSVFSNFTSFSQDSTTRVLRLYAPLLTRKGLDMNPSSSKAELRYVSKIKGCVINVLADSGIRARSLKLAVLQVLVSTNASHV